MAMSDEPALPLVGIDEVDALVPGTLAGVGGGGVGSSLHAATRRTVRTRWRFIRAILWFSRRSSQRTR
jgi:hypothetical protein